jgi:MipA family protein
MNSKHKYLLFSILFIFNISAHAQEKISSDKNWELGLGLGALHGPDYRGSEEYRTYASPIPYFIYHGKFIRSDRDGIRGRFFESNNLEFSLSASAVISPDTDENKLRQGMPELGSTFEIGPSLNYKLTGDDFSNGLSLQLPLRAVFAFADEAEYAGYLFQPQLAYRTNFSDWNFHYRLGITYADNRYHDYYYSVMPKYATSTRLPFDASSGYSGIYNQIALTRKIRSQKLNMRLAFFLRYENIEGSNFTDSPLVQTSNVWRSGMAVIWVIK